MKFILRSFLCILVSMSTIVLVGSTNEWEHLLSGVISARESGDYATSIKLSNEALKLAEDAFG